jgi:hypothetical protein
MSAIRNVATLRRFRLHMTKSTSSESVLVEIMQRNVSVSGEIKNLQFPLSSPYGPKDMKKVGAIYSS